MTEFNAGAVDELLADIYHILVRIDNGDYEVTHRLCVSSYMLRHGENLAVIDRQHLKNAVAHLEGTVFKMNETVTALIKFTVVVKEFLHI